MAEAVPRAAGRGKTCLAAADGGCWAMRPDGNLPRWLPEWLPALPFKVGTQL